MHSNRFLRDIDIKYGPAELLARFFFKAVSVAGDRGVELELVSFEELMQINAAHQDSWFPMTTSFRPDIGGISELNGAAFIGRNRGEPVAAYVVKFLDWSATNFKAEAESLRFFYADPHRDSNPGECCNVNAPNAAELSGLLAHVGGAWFRPDYRGVGLAEIIPRLGRAYSLARWGIDASFGVIMSHHLDTGLDRRLGYKQDCIASGTKLWNHPVRPDDWIHLILAWMKRDDLVDDLFQFIMEFDTQIDVRVRQSGR